MTDGTYVHVRHDWRDAILHGDRFAPRRHGGLRRAGMGVCAVPALGNSDRVPLIFAGYVLN